MAPPTRGERSSARSTCRMKSSGVENRPEMNDPTEEEEPENARQNELDHGDDEPSLE
jgi:hypothetical protein